MDDQQQNGMIVMPTDHERVDSEKEVKDSAVSSVHLIYGLRFTIYGFFIRRTHFPQWKINREEEYSCLKQFNCHSVSTYAIKAAAIQQAARNNQVLHLKRLRLLKGFSHEEL